MVEILVLSTPSGVAMERIESVLNKAGSVLTWALIVLLTPVDWALQKVIDLIWPPEPLRCPEGVREAILTEMRTHGGTITPNELRRSYPYMGYPSRGGVRHSILLGQLCSEGLIYTTATGYENCSHFEHNIRYYLYRG